MNDERRYFAQNKHFYLIEQVQSISQSVDISRDDNAIDLSFNHPVKELIWVVQSDDVKDKNQKYNGIYNLSGPFCVVDVKKSCFPTIAFIASLFD